MDITRRLFAGSIVGIFAWIVLPAVCCASDEIVLGAIHWKDFAYAEMMKNSYEMAAEEINAEGGIGGKTIKLVMADDRGRRRDGEKAVDDLVRNHGAVMLIGGYSSSNTLYTAMAADRHDVPFLVTTAADDRITQRGLENVFRLNPPASAYTNGLEAFMLEKVRPRSMAIVYENSPYGTSGAMKMMWFGRENDIELTAIIPYFRERAGQDYFGRILKPLKTSAPDVIYMVSYLKDAVQLVNTIRGMPSSALLCGGAGGFTHYKFIEQAAATGDGLVTAALWGPETEFAGARAYYDQYMARFHHPPDYHGAEAYSAVLVAAEALKNARDHQPESIRTALARIEMETPFGPVQFDSDATFARQNWIDTLVFQIADNQFRCIWPETLATRPFTPPAYWRSE